MTIEEHKKTVIQIRRTINMIKNSLSDLEGERDRAINVGIIASQRSALDHRFIMAYTDLGAAEGEMYDAAMGLAIEMTNEDMK